MSATGLGLTLVESGKALKRIEEELGHRGVALLVSDEAEASVAW